MPRKLRLTNFASCKQVPVYCHDCGQRLSRAWEVRFGKTKLAFIGTDCLQRRIDAGLVVNFHKEDEKAIKYLTKCLEDIFNSPLHSIQRREHPPGLKNWDWRPYAQRALLASGLTRLEAYYEINNAVDRTESLE